MNRFIKYSTALTEVVLIGTIISFVIAFIMNGLQWDLILTMNITFYIGLCIALAGGIKNVASFFNFKKRLKKTPLHEDVVAEKKEEAMRWDYIFLVGGLIIFGISFLMATAMPS